MSCIPGTAPKPWGLRRTELHLYWIAPGSAWPRGSSVTRRTVYASGYESSFHSVFSGHLARKVGRFKELLWPGERQRGGRTNYGTSPEF